MRFREIITGQEAFKQLVSFLLQTTSFGEILKGRHEVIVRPYKHSRSIEQNSKWNAICRDIASETGNTVNEIRDYCKQEFLPYSTYEFMGVVQQRTVSTTELNTEQMTELITRTEALASTLGVANDGDV
jgi:hypothetical protein|tara:strand:+ start:1451 stop:1837 length:387 start_codon:yes stop_codon:yes gene_type:complete